MSEASASAESGCGCAGRGCLLTTTVGTLRLLALAYPGTAEEWWLGPRDLHTGASVPPETWPRVMEGVLPRPALHEGSEGPWLNAPVSFVASLSRARAASSACARNAAALAAFASRFNLASSIAASWSERRPLAAASSRARSSFCAAATRFSRWYSTNLLLLIARAVLTKLLAREMRPPDVCGFFASTPRTMQIFPSIYCVQRHFNMSA
mmetsp:Transcript_20219/g.42675  ORF Transcript_20219/g.42675 Transcript_20219/m.42675 type:complete len:209 (-) Transcript_20219:188-814(-)